jgi:hypothetical protein
VLAVVGGHGPVGRGVASVGACRVPELDQGVVVAKVDYFAVAFVRLAPAVVGLTVALLREAIALVAPAVASVGRLFSYSL